MALCLFFVDFYVFCECFLFVLSVFLIYFLSKNFKVKGVSKQMRDAKVSPFLRWPHYQNDK